MINLREVVDRYRTLANGFGEPVALQAFSLSDAETVSLFAFMDEDYHISRFLSLSLAEGKEGKEYVIEGNRVTHVRMDEEILEIL
jgi:hypothetical protein